MFQKNFNINFIETQYNSACLEDQILQNFVQSYGNFRKSEAGDPEKKPFIVVHTPTVLMLWYKNQLRKGKRFLRVKTSFIYYLCEICNFSTNVDWPIFKISIYNYALQIRFYRKQACFCPFKLQFLWAKFQYD